MKHRRMILAIPVIGIALALGLHTLHQNTPTPPEALPAPQPDSLQDPKIPEKEYEYAHAMFLPKSVGQKQEVNAYVRRCSVLEGEALKTERVRFLVQYVHKHGRTSISAKYLRVYDYLMAPGEEQRSIEDFIRKTDQGSRLVITHPEGQEPYSDKGRIVPVKR
jgi:hypothetical protein